MPLTTSRVLEANKKKRHVEFNRDLPLKTLISTSMFPRLRGFAADSPNNMNTSTSNRRKTHQKPPRRPG